MTLHFRGVPSSEIEGGSITGDKKDFPKLYQVSQEEMDSQLVEQESTYKGSEGEMWYGYIPKDNSWVVFKCKPHQIEQIHWSSSTAIHRNTIRGAALNGLESFETLTVANVKTLLEEEFDAESIKKSESRIKKIVDNINADLYYFGEVERLLDESEPMSRGDTMRYLIQELKSKDRRIFRAAQMYMKKKGILEGWIKNT